MKSQAKLGYLLFYKKHIKTTERHLIVSFYTPCFPNVHLWRCLLFWSSAATVDVAEDIYADVFLVTNCTRQLFITVNFIRFISVYVDVSIRAWQEGSHSASRVFQSLATRVGVQ